MTGSGGFQGGARVWDLFSPPEERLKREGPFLARWAGNATQVLELACGHGYHSAFLAESGPVDRRVMATDLSAGMVAEAMKRHFHPRVRFQTGSMVEPPDGSHERIFILGNSVNLLPDRSQVRALFLALRAVTAPAGEILMQFLNPLRPEYRVPRVQGFRRSRGGREWVLVKSLVPMDGTTHLTLSAFPKGGEERQVETAELLDLTPSEMDDFAQSAGFSKARWSGNMGEDPFVEGVSVDAVGIWTRGRD